MFYSGNRLKVRWVSFFLWLQNFCLKILRLALFSEMRKPSHIVIFRTGSIGDNICAMPAIVAIHEYFIDSRIDILTTSGARSPVSMERLLSPRYYNELIDYGGLSASNLFRLLRRKKYDLVIELPQSMVSFSTQIRNMFFFRAAGIRSGSGWQVATCLAFRQAQDKLMSFQPEAERLLSLLAPLGVTSPVEHRYPLHVTTSDQGLVGKLFEDRKLTSFSKRKLVAIVPGSKRPQNRYPFERFLELASWLTSRGYGIVVIGGPEDVDRGKELESIAGVVSCAGMVTPIQSAVILSKCFVTVTNDTGPMHLSYAVGTPVISIFSARDFREKWFPPRGNVVLRNADIHCSLCLSETCRDNICMKRIPLESIKAAFAGFDPSE
jgi:ADP-heptose:LPS heptosyltransferase